MGVGEERDGKAGRFNLVRNIDVIVVCFEERTGRDLTVLAFFKN